MSRPAHAAPLGSFDNRGRLPTMTTAHDDIRVLLDGPPAPSLDSLEEALTTGYAHALGLEGERLRIERRLRELVREPGPRTGGRSRRIAALAADLADADRELERLRGLLATLRKHVQPVSVRAG
jgi:hypothetical protein